MKTRNTNKILLLLSIGLVFSSAQAQTPEPTVITSVSQVTDVKPGDPAHAALQNLIERYGVQNLLIGTEFRPASALNSAELEKITRGALETIENLRVGNAIPTRLVASFLAQNCEVKPANPLAVSGREVADYLKCTMGYEDAEKIALKAAPISRGEFAGYLVKSLETASGKIYEFFPTPQLVQTDFLAQIKARLGAKDSAGALALYARLEAGTYDYGDAATQPAVAAEPLMTQDKAAILLQLRRFDEADALYERTFELQIEKARVAIADALARREKNQPAGARQAIKTAESHLAQAQSTKTSRDATYLAQNLNNQKKIWSLVLDARLAEVQKLLTQAQN